MTSGRFKKDDIINAATIEFLEQGLRKATMQSIADNAKVSKRTLYKYFSSKDELYNEIVDELFNEIKDSFNFTFKEDVSFEDLLESIIYERLQLLRSDKMLSLSRLVISESLKSNPLNDKAQEKMLSLDQHFIKWFITAQDKGYLNPQIPPEIIMEHFRGLITGIILFPLLTKMRKPLTDDDVLWETKNIKRTFLKAFGSGVASR